MISVQHEAGHFLIAYLVGILPKGYTLTGLEALKKEGSLNIQAGTAFVDFEFLEEVGCFLQYVVHLCTFLLSLLHSTKLLLLPPHSFFSLGGDEGCLIQGPKW